MLPPTKPYLIRAIYEWCTDNGYAPYISVSVDTRTRAPRAYVEDGLIVLNIGPDATQGLTLGNDEICFQARFNGAVQSLTIPVDRVAAIYASENGQGMAFDVAPVDAQQPGDPAAAGDPGGGGSEPPAAPGGRSHLTRVK